MKSQGAKLSFSSVSVRWGRAGAFTLPQGTVAQRGRTLGNSRGRARRGEEKDRERDLPGAAAGFLPAAGNRRWDFSLPGKTEARCGPTPGTSRVRARLKCRYKHGARLARRSRACVRGCFLLSFAFSCLAFASQTSFHLSLRPRRASTFFRKESRQRFAKGLRPFEPHSCALRPIFFSSALLAGLAALWAANRRQIRETLEKPRSKAQLFKRFCAKGDAPELPACPGKQEPGVGLHPERTACVRNAGKKKTQCANCPPQAGCEGRSDP